jgi:N-acetylneuraminate synthase/N,N'-diacetyllegionaminate synthase
VAEVGINHNGDIGLAKQMIDVAIECGVDAIKFQTFKAEEFVACAGGSYTYRSQGKEVTESMYEMFKRYEFSREEWGTIFAYCKDRDITFFSTPQNPSDLDFLLSLVKLPAIKVGSDDLTNLPLLRYYASKGLPMIISTGMATLGEIEDAVRIIKSAGNDDLIILHCVSSYPADAEEVNLRRIKTIEQAFNVIVGFSDHTIGLVAAIGAVAFGAKVIEKHFTLDKDLPGPDHWFSADPGELRRLVEDVRLIEEALGSSVITPTQKEWGMRDITRRSIVAKRDIAKGDIISEDMLTLKRPGTGLPPKFIEYVLGKEARVFIKKDELIDFTKVS